MSFKLLYTNLAGPQGDFLVDPTATFEAGMLGTLTGNAAGLPVVALAVGVPGGRGADPTFIGVIDDNKSGQFMATVVNENIASGSTTLANSNIVSGTLSVIRGAGVNPAGFNYTNGTFASAITSNGMVSYSYYIPGKAGDDTTLASGKCTFWIQPGEYATDVYEVGTTGTSNSYAVGSLLYCSTNSKLTDNVAVTGGSIVVAYTTKTPSAGNPFLHFYKV